ncbi:MAG: hypothetical protein ABI927_05180, partial [Gaiellaceae bacterium]
MSFPSEEEGGRRRTGQRMAHSSHGRAPRPHLTDVTRDASSSVSTDEISDRYLEKAIAEVNALG